MGSSIGWTGRMNPSRPNLYLYLLHVLAAMQWFHDLPSTDKTPSQSGLSPTRQYPSGDCQTHAIFVGNPPSAAESDAGNPLMAADLVSAGHGHAGQLRPGCCRGLLTLGATTPDVGFFHVWMSTPSAGQDRWDLDSILILSRIPHPTPTTSGYPTIPQSTCQTPVTMKPSILSLLATSLPTSLATTIYLAGDSTMATGGGGSGTDGT